MGRCEDIKNGRIYEYARLRKAVDYQRPKGDREDIVQTHLVSPREARRYRHRYLAYLTFFVPSHCSSFTTPAYIQVVNNSPVLLTEDEQNRPKSLVGRQPFEPQSHNIHREV